MGDLRRGVDQCVHCGFCLESCPTYVVTRSEVHSPRGRIEAVRLGLGLEGIETCMFCRRCEEACPSGVPYGEILSSVRRPGPAKSLLLRALEDPSSLVPLARSLASPRLRKFLEVVEAPLQLREEGAEVVLFPGCIMSVSFRPTVERAVSLLRPHRVEVVNGCCGLAHRSEGDLEGERRALESLREKFRGRRVVSLSSNCTAHLRERGMEVEDFSEFLLSEGEWEVQGGVAGRPGGTPTGADGGMRGGEGGVQEEGGEETFTIHEPCHAHLMGFSGKVREFMRKQGSRIREMEDPSFECGAGGSQFLFQPEVSDMISSLKEEKVRRTGAGVVISTNPSCSMVMRARGLRVVHLADIVRRRGTGGGK